MAPDHSHSHGTTTHSHGPDVDHGHTHEVLDGPGSYFERDMPIIEGRDWKERAFTVGIGGYATISDTDDFRIDETYAWRHKDR